MKEKKYIKICFWKNNKTDGEYFVPIKKLIKEFNKSIWVKLDQPFERSFLIFLGERSFGKDTFDINKAQWEQIYLVKNKLENE